jgi:peptide/nickel transport system permease protein
MLHGSRQSALSWNCSFKDGLLTQISELKHGTRHSPAWIVCRGIIILLISGLAGATLTRLAPGFGIDERVLDPRLSVQSLETIEHEHAAERNPLTFYIRFLAGMLRGDAGRSVVFAQPVGPLIGERAPRTFRTVMAGLGYGWSAAVLLAITAALSRRAVTVLAAMAVSGSLLSIPSAVVAATCLLFRLSPAIAIAAVVFPRIFPNAYEQLRASLTVPHVVTARARGLPATRLFLFHVVPSALMPLVALAGVSVTLAFGASIPVEALADSPGIGQLAWQAALGRDLPVLVSVTLLLTAITVTANVLADLVLARLGGHTA